MRQLKAGVKPLPLKNLSEHAMIGVRAHRQAARKLRQEHRRWGLPLLVFKGGKMVEVQP